ncbi:MAG: AAA family ATPase [Conexibacter sp.]
MNAVREVLSAFAAHGLDTRPDELGQLAWDADCPSCRHLSDAGWPLRIDHGPGGSVRLRCISGCTQQAVLAAVGLGWQAPSLGVLPAPVPVVREAPVERAKLVLRDIERMIVTDPLPLPWLMKPILARGSVTLLSGPAKSGKSMFGMALVSATGRGETVVGIECQQGSALVIDAENGECEVHRRVRGLRIQPETLTYAGTQGFSLRRDFDWVEDAVSQYRPDLLVLDSFRSLTPGEEENDSGAVEAILALVRSLAQRHDCAVLVLHHTSKAGGPRGSSAFAASVDIAFELTRNGKTRVLSNPACRIAPEADPIAFTITNHEDGTVGLEAATAPKQTDRAHSGRQTNGSRTSSNQLEDRFVRVLAEHGELKRGELCRLAGVSSGDGHTNHTLNTAIATGRIRKIDRGLYAPALAERPSLPPSATSSGGEEGEMDLATDHEAAA